jgi:hypothetical protein
MLKRCGSIAQHENHVDHCRSSSAQRALLDGVALFNNVDEQPQVNPAEDDISA